MNRHFLLVTWMVGGWFAVGPVVASKSMAVTPPSHMNVQIVVEEVSRCPSWITSRADEQEIRSGITRLYRELAVLDNQTIRAGLAELLSNLPGGSIERFQTDAKVFAFLRVLFEIPSGFLAGAQSYGSWGSPVDEGRVNLLWPYELDAEGNLVLAGTGGRYFGPPYDALAEFDELSSRYPRRRPEERKDSKRASAP